MDHLGIARRDLGAEGIGLFQDHHLASGGGQGTGHGEPDHARPGYHDVGPVRHAGRHSETWASSWPRYRLPHSVRMSAMAALMSQTLDGSGGFFKPRESRPPTR